jgi:hypothetical protein
MGARSRFSTIRSRTPLETCGPTFLPARRGRGLENTREKTQKRRFFNDLRAEEPDSADGARSRRRGRPFGANPTAPGNEPVAHITNRPWIAYGPTGLLAARWRNAYSPYNAASFLVPGTQNVFAAISRNNGTTFSAPVQLNSAPSPPPDPTQLAEDDVSWVAVTSQYVYGARGVTGERRQRTR